jgi:hypothetical protein
LRTLPRDVRFGAFGVLVGVAAVAAGRCAGGACSSCFACAVPGAAALLLAALGRPPIAAPAAPDRPPEARAAPGSVAATPDRGRVSSPRPPTEVLARPPP